MYPPLEGASLDRKICGRVTPGFAVSVARFLEVALR
jgi:hypothetical protein